MLRQPNSASKEDHVPIGEDTVGRRSCAAGCGACGAEGTIHSSRVSRERRMVDGKGLEPSTSALRTPRSPN